MISKEQAVKTRYYFLVVHSSKLQLLWFANPTTAVAILVQLWETIIKKTGIFGCNWLPWHVKSSTIIYYRFLLYIDVSFYAPTNPMPPMKSYHLKPSPPLLAPSWQFSTQWESHGRDSCVWASARCWSAVRKPTLASPPSLQHRRGGSLKTLIEGDSCLGLTGTSVYGALTEPAECVRAAEVCANM